jgi:hypothetical protein
VFSGNRHTAVLTAPVPLKSSRSKSWPFEESAAALIVIAAINVQPNRRLTPFIAHLTAKIDLFADPKRST